MQKSGNVLLAATGLLSLVGAIFLVAVRPAGSVTGAPVPVQVSNTAVSPVVTRDTDNSAQQPVQFLKQPDTLGTGLNDAESDFSVPVGKRLVIEYVAASLGVGSGNVTMETTVNGVQLAYYFIENTSQHSHSFFPTKIYADPGTNVQVFVHSANGQRVFADVEVSGHYVNVP